MSYFIILVPSGTSSVTGKTSISTVGFDPLLVGIDVILASVLATTNVDPAGVNSARYT